VEFQVFKSIEEALRVLPYSALVPAELLGTKRTCHIRWLDPTTDIFFQTYFGLTSVTTDKALASKLLLLLQGNGQRCSISTAGAPATQRGSFKLRDGRDAVWAIGLQEKNWARSGPVWVAWSARNRQVVRRIEGIGYDINALRSVADLVSSMES
jgi:hypothetical protein